jgi:hypothetical protein
MSLNPFQEKGMPIDKQLKYWSDINSMPYDPNTVHPYTRTRGILMNGIEVEAAFFNHNFHRHTDNPELRNQLALVRRLEQQQQKMVNWMIPASESTLEVTIGYEQLAVDLTASMAKNEPDQYVKAALDFALIEDFDHLYRYANLMLDSDPRRAETIVKDLTEVMPGRPTVLEHRFPTDDVRTFIDRTKAAPITLMHISTIVAAEQQTMNFYMNIGNRIADLTGRGLYQEIGMIEEQHVTHYGSLLDPRASWFEMAVMHEYNECYMYYSCMVSEPDERVKKIWEQLLECEIAHLLIASQNMKKYDNKDPSEIYPTSFPAPTIIESSKDYVREVIANQLSYTGDGTKMVPLKNVENQERYLQYQKMVNGGEYIPSQKVISNVMDANGSDYRIESNGAYPVNILRDRRRVPSRDDLIDYEMS